MNHRNALPTGAAGRVTDSSAGVHHSAGEDVMTDDEFSAHIDQLVRGTRDAAELVASLTGRWPRTHLLHRYELPRVDDPGLTLLQTCGPASGRDIQLIDPGLLETAVVATSMELIVPDRLPQAVVVDLQAREDPLDRLLDDHDVDWDSQLVRLIIVPSLAVQVLRRIWLGSEIGALVSEEHFLDADQLAASGWQGAAITRPST